MLQFISIFNYKWNKAQVLYSSQLGAHQKLLDELTLLRKPWHHLTSMIEKQINKTVKYEKEKNGALPCNHCFSANVINITYSECAHVALEIQHAMRMRHIVICGLDDYKIFHIIS